MIQSFFDKETEKIFLGESSKKISFQVQRVALRKLIMLDASVKIQDLKVQPANRLEKLLGDRKGQHSIRINDKYRICFVWRSGNAHSVEICDYH